MPPYSTDRKTSRRLPFGETMAADVDNAATLSPAIPSQPAAVAHAIVSDRPISREATQSDASPTADRLDRLHGRAMDSDWPSRDRRTAAAYDSRVGAKRPLPQRIRYDRDGCLRGDTLSSTRRSCLRIGGCARSISGTRPATRCSRRRVRSCLVVDDRENPGRVLYGVSPTDAVSFSAALALVMTVVLVASLIQRGVPRGPILCQRCDIDNP
jgi:hypothetical protein